MEAVSLISIGTWIATKIADKGFDNISNKIIGDKTLSEKFYLAVSKVSTELQNKYPDVLGNNIKYFFKKEEIFNELFKLLFRSSVVNLEKISEMLDVNTLPINFINEFVILLKQELLNDRTFDEIFSNNELFILFQGLSSSVKEIAENSTITSKKITQISKLLEEKIGLVFDYKQFIYVYTKNAINNLSQINFIGLGIDISIKKNRKDLQDIFVRPFFEFADFRHNKNTNKELYNRPFEKKKRIIDYKNLLNISDRIVILGNPGAGKSVLIKSLICDILRKRSNEFKNKTVCDFLPFRIELRNYLAFKNEHKGNLVKYLIFILEHEYQISNVTEPILSTILNNQCLLFFDGLDEIFDLTDKINVRNDIENFHNQYSKIKSIVTSRIIGYEEASLDKTFTEINILNFNDSQIEAYVKQWYSKEEEIDEVRNREIEGFLSKKHEIDPELITNPLLLSLIVILYRNILKLPESKLEIYQSCTKTLVDKWDASKELKIDLDENIYKAKDKLFADLAYWQYKELSGKTDRITYEKAKANIGSSLIKLGIADEYSSDDLSERFMIYAQKRSIYFENNFTHKTFLEYYTAYWIYSNIEKKHKVAERNSLISLYIGNPFWFIVFELLFNLIDKDQADNDIIDELFEFLLVQNSDSLQFLLSVSFKIKNISLKMVEKTVDNSIRFLLNKFENNDINKNYTKRNENGVYIILRSLLSSDENSFVLVVNRFKKFEKEFETDFDMLIKLYVLYSEPHLIFQSKFKIFSGHLNQSLYESCCEQNAYLFILNIYSSLLSTVEQFNSFIRFINLFGVNALYKDFSAIYDTFGIARFFTLLPRLLVEEDQINNFKNNLKSLEENGLSRQEIIKQVSALGSFYLDTSNVKNILEYLKYNRELYSVKIISLILVQGHEDYNPYGERLSFKELIHEYRDLEEIAIISSNETKQQKIKKIIALKNIK